VSMSPPSRSRRQGSPVSRFLPRSNSISALELHYREVESRLRHVLRAYLPQIDPLASLTNRGAPFGSLDDLSNSTRPTTRVGSGRIPAHAQHPQIQVLEDDEIFCGRGHFQVSGRQPEGSSEGTVARDRVSTSAG
jgi:hypothetical protein